ncbi:hypothetical protein [Actinoplanes sp. NPDC051494]|uniref:hypothetical protein n=1 Tax=Actinoplanes sp. NPDC051494 TaxID=3363907 RepID=UPI00378E12B3
MGGPGPGSSGGGARPVGGAGGPRSASGAGGPRPASGAGGGRPGSGRAGNGDEQSERGLRGLVGSGSSQVSVTAAMRARDAARPSEADLAAAESELSIVRRNWMPREDLPRNHTP